MEEVEENLFDESLKVQSISTQIKKEQEQRKEKSTL